jgi:imidazolonepropionase-like amidohydrolase
LPIRTLHFAHGFLLALSSLSLAQTPATSGTFVLHKFAQPIGKETYTIEPKGDTYTLTSHFLFTDRASSVPLETTFTAHAADMLPMRYAAKGRASRQSVMDDIIGVSADAHPGLTISVKGKVSTQSPSGAWFVTDGYSPVAMQEQMMRWWLLHKQPASFAVFPANAQVTIQPAGELTVEGHAVHGYTVSGLIWGQECLWLDDAQNLVALISIDAEFDHFEALREAYATDLGTFIAAAVENNLGALARVTAKAKTAPAKKLAITGATLEDSTGAPAVYDSVILMEDGVITAAGPRNKVKVPKGFTTLDAKGKFAIPGLWDMHAHYEQVEWGPIYLAAGVTSVRDVGNEFDFIRTLHDQLNRKVNPAIGPHIEFAGIIDGDARNGKYTLGAIIATTPAEAQNWVARYKAAGAKQIKIYSSVKPEIVKAIAAAAHAQGMTVTGHIPFDMTAIDGINAGIDQINHWHYEADYFVDYPNSPDGKPDDRKPPTPDFDGPRAKELLAVMKQHGTVADPTIALYESFLRTVPYDRLEPGIDHLPPQLKAALDGPIPAMPADQVALQRSIMLHVVQAMHQAGIPIVAGTDQAIPGYSLHREIELYVDAGFTPLEALQSATIVAARALGVEKESGSLEPGKRGDVLLLDADPLADIHNTRKVWRTVAAGAVYTPAPLWQSVDFQP